MRIHKQILCPSYSRPKKKIDRVSNIIAKPIHLLTTGQTGTLSLAGTFLEYKTWCILGECLDKFSSLGALGEMF